MCIMFSSQLVTPGQITANSICWQKPIHRHLYRHYPIFYPLMNSINKQKTTITRESWGNKDLKRQRDDETESLEVGKHKERVYNWKDVKNEVSVWSIGSKGHRSRSPNSAQSTLIRATNQTCLAAPDHYSSKVQECTHTYTISLCVALFHCNFCAILSQWFSFPDHQIIFYLALFKPTSELWFWAILRSDKERQTAGQRQCM